MIVRGLCLSDIHFGLPCSQRMYEELTIVKDFINKNELDVIHINGDFFDRKLSFSEPAAMIAMQFFFELRELCIKKKIKLRIIHGTMGHERNQTEMFRMFESRHLDMKIYNNVAEEELFPGFNVLYVPEEYPVDADAYYAEYKAKKYNAMMGHGMWDFVALQSNIDEGDRKDVNSAPVLKYDDWKDSLEYGFAIFGHIHARHVYKKKIFYPGSYSAWDFSDLSKRGFAYYTYDTEEKKYNVRIIDNTLCPKFGTINVGDLGLDLATCSVDDIKAAVQNASTNYDFFRLDLDTLPVDKLELLKKTYKDDNRIKVKLPKKKLLLETDNSAFDKFNYIFNEADSVENIVLKFIQEEMKNSDGADTITAEMVKEILTIE